MITVTFMYLVLLAVYNIFTNQGNVMSGAQFTLNNKVSNGTSNISYLLDETHIQYLRTLTPRELEAAFGPGDEELCDDEYNRAKGYTDPEWYWSASDGNVWGLGWRWGEPRLRGRGGNTGAARVHPDKLSAYEFVEFIRAAAKSEVTA